MSRSLSPEKTAPRVGVIVPFYNAEKTLPETLSALMGQTMRVGEMVLVDDGSTDGGAAFAETAAQNDPRLRLLRKSRGGEASALNTGLAALLGGRSPEDLPAFVAIVEADVVPEPGWLSAALSELGADGTVGGCGGVLQPDPQDPWIARLAGYEVARRFPTQAADVLHITSAAAVYRREVFKRVERFREDLVNASLDSEFNVRVRQAGWRLRFTPAARARHRYKPTLAGYLARQYAYGKYRSGTPALFLYPQDCSTALEMLLTWGLLGVAAVLGWAAPGGAVAALLSAGALQLPFAVRTFRATGDRAAWGACVAFPLRYFAAGLGVLRGIISSSLFFRLLLRPSPRPSL